MSDRKAPQSGQHVLVRLSRREHEFLMSRVTLPKELKSVLYLGAPKDGEVICRFPLELYAQLMELLGKEGEAAWDERRSALLADIQAKLVWSLETHFFLLAAITHIFPPGMAEDVLEYLVETQSDPATLTQDELVQRFKEWDYRKFFSPDPAQGGLSRSQVNDLIQRNWVGPEPVVGLNDGLAMEDLSNAHFCFNTRLLLQFLIDQGPIKLTSKGCFNRKCLNHFLDTFHFPSNYVKTIREYCKVVNEPVVHRIATVRVVARLAGLVSLREGKLSITKMGVKMLKDENVGALYHRLFTTFFDKFNIAFQDRMIDAEEIQATAPFIIYMVGQKAVTWRDYRELAREVLLPFVERAIPKNKYIDIAAQLVRGRILDSLHVFGLLDARYSEGPDKLVLWLDQYRKTPLFDRFFTFKFGPAKA